MNGEEYVLFYGCMVISLKLRSRATVEALCFFETAKVVQIVRHLSNLS